MHKHTCLAICVFLYLQRCLRTCSICGHLNAYLRPCTGKLYIERMLNIPQGRNILKWKFLIKGSSMNGVDISRSFKALHRRRRVCNRSEHLREKSMNNLLPGPLLFPFNHSYFSIPLYEKCHVKVRLSLHLHRYECLEVSFITWETHLSIDQGVIGAHLIKC